MNRLFLSILLCLIFGATSFCQDNTIFGKVKYEWTKTKPYVDIVSTELIFDETQSLFNWKNENKVDKNDTNTTHFFSNSKDGLERWVFKNSSERLIYLKLFAKDMGYLVQNDQLNFDWDLKDEYKTIHNFKCQKATTTYKNTQVTAWFTEEVAIGYGPHIWTGLPGLILEVYDDKLINHFVATNLEIDQKAFPEIKKLNEIEIKEYISVSEYESILNSNTRELEDRLNSRRGLNEKPIKFKEDCEDCN